MILTVLQYIVTYVINEQSITADANERHEIPISTRAVRANDVFPQWLFEAAVAAVVGPLQNEIRRATESVSQAGPSLQHCPTSSPSLNRGASFLPSI